MKEKINEVYFGRPLEQKNGVFIFEILPLIREIFKFLLKDW